MERPPWSDPRGAARVERRDEHAPLVRRIKILWGERVAVVPHKVKAVLVRKLNDFCIGVFITRCRNSLWVDSVVAIASEEKPLTLKMPIKPSILSLQIRQYTEQVA